MNRESYTLCYHNGKKHIDLAIRLGEEKDYGTAISFLVLGLEELIKYLVIQNYLADNKLFTDKEINSMFGSHTKKHEIIIEFLESTKPEFGEKFTLSVFKIMTKQPLTDDLKAVQANRFKEFGSMFGLTEQHLTVNEIDSFINWFNNKADTFKNKGLYVDREDKSTHLNKSKLISPNTIGEDDFNFVLKFSDSFFKQVTFSKDLDITDEELIDILNIDYTNSDNN
jgi:AbiV family abortive infection protein